MGDVIHKLSTITSNQIAAGEVVKRPSSVVKELMENAIDANSTMIIVNIEDGGKELIQVIDDGIGMSYNDAFAAFERHATSKIHETNDLFALKTFGFRGEALPSIASVSEVELKTCRDIDDTGCRLVISGGELQKQVKEFTTKGTQVSVKKLFFNVPQRRNFLKSTSSEIKHIINEFKKVALCNPQISMFLYSNKKCLYNLPIGTLRNRVNNIIGKNINNQLMEVSVETSIAIIKGYIGSPETISQQAEQFMFVNGRFFRMSYFNRAIMKAFESIMPNNKSLPRYFLYFTVDPGEIDVNADPEKVDVKFENESQIWQILYSSVKAVLGKNGITPSIDFDISNQISIPGEDSFKSIAAEIPTPGSFNPFNERFSFTKAVGEDDTLDYKKYEQDTPNYQKSKPSKESTMIVSECSFADILPSEPFNYEPQEIVIEDTISSNSFGEVERLVNSFEGSNDDIFSSSFMEFTPVKNHLQQPVIDRNTSEIESDNFLIDKRVPLDINQLGECMIFNKYIIAQIGEKVLFVKIISALNRICYDRYSSMVKKRDLGAVNKLMFPTTIPLSVTHRAIIDQSREDLQSIGFEIAESSVDGAIEVTGIPSGYDKYNLYEVFEDILESISGDDIDGYNEKKREVLISRLSSVEAIKRSKYLNREECRPLVIELFSCENYRFSPKGRPIFLELDIQQINDLLK